jgi:hypothetical protein
MHVVTNEKDFRKAMGAELAIIFCHAEWSMPSVTAKRTIEDWYRRDSGVEQKSMVPLFLVMPYEQAFVCEWLAREGFSGLESRGSGEVLWVEQGHVVDKVLFNVSENELRGRTRQRERMRQRWG